MGTARRNATMNDISIEMDNISISSSASRINRRRATVNQLYETDNPHIKYCWKDERRNVLLTYEILMYGEVDSRSVEVDLVPILRAGRDTGKQKLFVKSLLPKSWISISHFKTNRCDMNDMADIARYNARMDVIKGLQNKYGLGQKSKVLSQQEFELPFQCDDFKMRDAYPNTGTWFDNWPVYDSDENGEPYPVGYVNVLNVQLVKVEKEMERKKQTPKRNNVRHVYANYNSSDDDDEGDQFGTPNGQQQDRFAQQQPDFQGSDDFL